MSFKCEYEECDRTYKMKSYLREHIKSFHKLTNSFKCSFCSKTFSRNIRRLRHEVVHTNERPYSCEECQMTFTTLYRLNVHKRIHTNNLYDCNDCEKKFTTKYDLRKHQRIHSNEKPFHCDVCLKSFRLAHHLTTHKLTHNDYRHFACDVCKKSYKSKISLKTHQKHHDDNSIRINETKDSFDEKSISEISNILTEDRSTTNISETKSLNDFNNDIQWTDDLPMEFPSFIGTSPMHFDIDLKSYEEKISSDGKTFQELLPFGMGNERKSDSPENLFDQLNKNDISTFLTDNNVNNTLNFHDNTNNMDNTNSLRMKEIDTGLSIMSSSYQFDDNQMSEGTVATTDSWSISEFGKNIEESNQLTDDLLNATDIRIENVSAFVDDTGSSACVCDCWIDNVLCQCKIQCNSSLCYCRIERLDTNEKYEFESANPFPNSFFDTFSTRQCNCSQMKMNCQKTFLPMYK
ncbi:hypothetical protein SNEBB_002155 [Seison nebaliae]|nr:hypothetical protein SNEBB_002155 [Seison nebaliae]